MPNVSLCVTENEVHYNPYVDPCQQYDYIDLGLPSGTLWATKNVGACDVTDCGNYYMYGMGSRTYNSADTQYAGTEDPLATSADTAAQVWGGDWHMPTTTQLQELTANTTYQWVTDYNGSGINGGLFAAQNGNSIFFPAYGYYNVAGKLVSQDECGMYWGSSLFNSYPSNFAVDNEDRTKVNRYNALRKCGYNVRGVVG